MTALRSIFIALSFAVFTAGILQGDNLKTAHQKANKAAAFVCSQNGACPVFPPDLFQEL
mgnify:CR=1 FL=1